MAIIFLFVKKGKSVETKKKQLYELIHEIYNQSAYPLSQVEKQAFFEAAQKLTNNQERISLIAYRLYPTVEKAAQSHQSYKELQYLKKLLLKYRWKYYLGVVLPSAFIR